MPLQELADKVKWVQNVHGNIINPFAAYIVQSPENNASGQSLFGFLLTGARWG